MSLQKDQERLEAGQRALEAARLAVLAAEEEVARAQRAHARAVKLRQEEPGPNSKVYITAVFPGGDPNDPYEYFALRGPRTAPDGKHWYVTGREGKVTWDELVRRIERARYEIVPIRVIL